MHRIFFMIAIFSKASGEYSRTTAMAKGGLCSTGVQENRSMQTGSNSRLDGQF